MYNFSFDGRANKLTCFDHFCCWFCACVDCVPLQFHWPLDDCVSVQRRCNPATVKLVSFWIQFSSVWSLASCIDCISFCFGFLGFLYVLVDAVDAYTFASQSNWRHASHWRCYFYSSVLFSCFSFFNTETQFDCVCANFSVSLLHYCRLCNVVKLQYKRTLYCAHL